MPKPPSDTWEMTGTADAAAIAEQYLRRGEPLLAYNAAEGALRQWPRNAHLRRLQALALARSGDIERANQILETLAREGVDDAETLGMLARTHKDLALVTADAPRRAKHLEAAFKLYDAAYRSAQQDDFAAASYSAINAAAAAALMGDVDRARTIAREVREICRQVDDDYARYWKEATLGEAALILGDTEAAAAHYGNAAIIADERWADLGTTRRQARVLAEHLPRAEGDVTRDLRIPPVVVFSGQTLDPAGDLKARFPASLDAGFREALRERLAAIGPLAVYSSAASAADILCLELARELGAETHVVLPFPPEMFKASSLDFAPGDWSARFDEALIEADSVTITSDHGAHASAATFEYADMVLTGMARLRSQALDTEVVDLHEQRSGAPVATPAEGNDTSPPEFRYELRAMLFADVVGSSQLSEDQLAGFVSEFLGAVADLNQRTRHRCEHVESSGDGLYMVFGDVAGAAQYALELAALANGFDWQSAGLPPTLNLRIALHAGPVHCGVDPVTRLPIYTGMHASRAARIEPITPAGQVYASSAFAAVAAAGGSDLAMHYVGRIPLAKGHGTRALYHVRAHRPA